MSIVTKTYNLDWGKLSILLTPQQNDLTGNFLWSFSSGISEVSIQTPNHISTTVSGLVSGGQYHFQLFVDGNVLEDHLVNISSELPTFENITEITDWNSLVILEPELNLNETIRLKRDSIVTEDTSQQINTTFLRENSNYYNDGDSELHIPLFQIRQNIGIIPVNGQVLSNGFIKEGDRITLLLDVTDPNLDINYFVSNFSSLQGLNKYSCLTIEVGNLTDPFSESFFSTIHLLDVSIGIVDSTTLSLTYTENIVLDGLTSTSSNFWITHPIASLLSIMTVNTFSITENISSLVIPNGTNNSLLFTPSVGVTTYYTFVIEVLLNGTVTREYSQTIIVTAPFIDIDVDQVQLSGIYTVDSLYVQSYTDSKFNGVQVRYYLNGELIKIGTINQDGQNESILNSALGSTGELTCRIVSGNGSSELSLPSIVTGPNVQLDILEPTSICKTSGSILGLIVNYTIYNTGLDTLTSNSRLKFEIEGLDIDTLNLSSTKGVFSKIDNIYYLTLSEDIVVDDFFNIEVHSQTHNCSETIDCIRISLELPTNYSTSCKHISNCYRFGLPPSDKPVLNRVRADDRLITGFGCPGGIIKQLFIKPSGSSEELVFNINKVIDPLGNIVVTIPSDISVELGDTISITQRCAERDVSPKSLEVVVEVSSILSNKCLSGVKIRGMDGQEYEVQIYNYTQLKVLGRGYYKGSIFGVSINFNEPNLRDEDLQANDIIGIRVVTECCPTLESNKLKYNPVYNLQLNYECNVSNGNNLASIRPTWLGGEFPMTVLLRDVTTNEVILLKTLNDASETVNFVKIPNGRFRIEVGDCGGCTTFKDFQSNCIKFSSTKSSTKNGTFYKQNCSNLCTPRPFIFTTSKSVTKYSIVSQEEADRLAQEEADRLAISEVQSTGQIQANIYGYCDNCSSPTPPPAPVFIPVPINTPTPIPVPVFVPVPIFIPTPVINQSCNLPSSVRITGNSNPTIGTTNNYGINIVGGSNYSLNWSVQGGTIIGSSNGTSVTVQWGNNTSNTSSITVIVSCSDNPNSVVSDMIGFVLIALPIPVPVYIPTPVFVPTPIPVPVFIPNPIPVPIQLPVTNCNLPIQVVITGNFSPNENTTETYSYTKTGGSSNNVQTWSVIGGEIIGSAIGTTVTVRWGVKSSFLNTLLDLYVSCGGDSYSTNDSKLINLVTTPVPVPLPVPIPTPVPVPVPVVINCITNVSITYNGTGNAGTQSSTISYTKCDGTVYTGGTYVAGNTYLITDCIREGSITMSGQFTVNSSVTCNPIPTPVPVPVPVPTGNNCITSVYFTYNPSGNGGAAQSSISYTRCDGSTYTGGTYLSGNTYVITDCIVSGTISMSGQFTIQSSQPCSYSTTFIPGLNI